MKFIQLRIKKGFLILVLFGLCACNNTTPDQVVFSDLFEMDKIDSIVVHNNQGRHVLIDLEQARFSNALINLLLEKDGSYKMGSVGFSLFVKGEEISFKGRTHGAVFETHANNIMKNKSWVKQEWLYFETNKLNLDNY